MRGVIHRVLWGYRREEAHTLHRRAPPGAQLLPDPLLPVQALLDGGQAVGVRHTE